MPNLLTRLNNSNINSEEEVKLFNRDFYSSGLRLIINKTMAQFLGFEEAILLGGLILKEKFLEDENLLNEENFFSYPEDDRVNDTGLSPYKQSRVIRIFQRLQILYPVKRKGNPPKQKFKLNHPILRDLITEISKLDSQNFEKYKYNKKILYNSLKDLKSFKLGLLKFKESKNKRSLQFIKPGSGEFAVLLSWNKLPLPAHAHVRLDTVLIKQAANFIDQMRNGIFGRNNRNVWDGGWLDKHKINQKEFEERKWKVREICQVIEGPLADMYRQGYWPLRKSGLPHSLVTAFYNPKKHSSFFIQAAYDPPGLLRREEKPKGDPYPDITEILIKEEILNLKQMKPDDWKRYFEGVKSLAKCLGDIDWENYGARQMFPGGRLGNPCVLIMQYVKWLKGDAPDIRAPRSIPTQIHMGMIRPDFWGWQEFMISVNRYWGRVFLCIPAEEK